MDFTKHLQIPGIAVFFDFERAFDSVEWDFIQKCPLSFHFGSQLREWVNVFCKDISSCMLNNGHACKQVLSERGERQGCLLPGKLFVIAIELPAQTIRTRSSNIKGIAIQRNQDAKLA